MRKGKMKKWRENLGLDRKTLEEYIEYLEEACRDTFFRKETARLSWWDK
jgi:hypothetical protein